MSARILIVDDTSLNVKLLAAKLAHEYYVVSTAENGEEALQKAALEKPDLILLDVMMPVMDGFETCRRLKADPATAHIPVIIITALTDIADRVKGLEEGADDFLAKPINDLALMARIKSLLRTKSLMDEWRLREETALQISPVLAESLAPLDTRNGRVMIIDDGFDDAEIIRNALTPMAAQVTQVQTMDEAEAILEKDRYDLVFSSLNLRGEDGLTICPRLRTNPVTRHLPILLIAGPDDLERVAKGLDLGANDYILRPLDAQELFARTRTQMRHKRNYDRLRDGFQHDLMLALVDPLTGAFNRRYLSAHLPRILQRVAEMKKSLSVQMIDIDFFKKINDTYGHHAGDAVLKEIARRISDGVRPSDFIVRMGGEEFAIVMPETTLVNAEKIAERIRNSIAEAPFLLPDSDKQIPVTVSIGVAETQPFTEREPDKVFDRADYGLYRAKETGRNKVVSYGTAT